MPASALQRWARWCVEHRRRVAAAWVVVVVVAVALAGVAAGESASNFTLPGSESQAALDLLQQRFPAHAGDIAQLVFRADAGARDPQVQATLEELFHRVAAVPHVVGVDSPYQAGSQAAFSPIDDHIGFATVQFDGIGPDVPQARVREVKELVVSASRPGLQTELGGSSSRSPTARVPAGEKVWVSWPRW